MISGLVTFKESETLEEAIKDGQVNIEGKTYKVRFGSRVPKDVVTISNKKLYIKGIPKDTEEAELNKLLGNCRISPIAGDKNVIFATFENEELQEEAMKKLENVKFNGKNVQVRKAFDKLSFNRSGYNGKKSTTQ